MKARLWIGSFIFVAVALVLFLFGQKLPEPEPASDPTAHEPAAVAERTPQMATPGRTPEKSRKTQRSNAVADFVQKSREDPDYEWKQPINFYGRVVDEHDKPVEGAIIDFVWNDLSPNGTSRSQAVADSAGQFTLRNKAGKGMSVTASRPGYYTLRDSRFASFEYANPAESSFFIPDPSKPVVFHLRKKGTPAKLVTSQYGISPDFPVPIPHDGTPLPIDVLTRKTNAAGQILLSQLTPSYETWKQAASWSFKMEIPDGGFIEHTDEFPFEAPESGYQSVVEYRFDKGSADWAEHLTKSYYIKFGNPARYGRLHVKTDISMGGAFLNYAINPDGSRNLEPETRDSDLLPTWK